MKNPRNRTLTTLITVFLLFSLLLASCREAEPKPAPVTTDAPETDPVTTAPTETDPPTTTAKPETDPPATDPPVTEPPVTDPPTTTAPPETEPPTTTVPPETTSPPETDPPNYFHIQFDPEQPADDIEFTAQLVYSPHWGGYVGQTYESVRLIKDIESLQFVAHIYEEQFRADVQVDGHPSITETIAQYNEEWFETNLLLIAEFDTRHIYLGDDGAICNFELSRLRLQNQVLWLDSKAEYGTITGNAYTFWFITVSRDQLQDVDVECSYILLNTDEIGGPR